MRHACLTPLLALVATSLSGCATLARGSYQKVPVVTDPPGATASTRNQTITTPGTLKVRRKDREVEVRIAKEGYVTKRVHLTRETHKKPLWLNTTLLPAGLWAGGEIANQTAPSRVTTCSGGPIGICSKGTHAERIVVGAVIGAAVVEGVAFGVDSASGAMYRLQPERLDVTLERVPSGLPSASDRSPQLPGARSTATKTDE